ncbi:MAG: aminotransferase class V-fold PLP-dependent enzyme [Myxococcota bacterium]
MTLDLPFVRGAFPGLDDELAFFENAGGSLPCAPVIDRVHRYLREGMVQLGASYPRSQAAGASVAAGKAAVGRLLGASAEDVIVGASTTMNMHVLAHALAPLLGPGDEVVVTNLDHEANVGAWRRMAEARGATIREWGLDPETAALTEAGLEAVLSERTRLVCFTHCSNVVGTIHDVAALSARAKAAGAFVCVDGVAFAPHRRVDVAALGVDLYAFSLYKTYGPHVACAYLAPELQARAASQNHFFLGPEAGTYRFEPGNVNHELTASIAGIVEYLEAVRAHHGGTGDAIGDAFARFAEHEALLIEPLLARLREDPRVRILGEVSSDPGRRVATVAFTVAGMASRALVERADAEGFAIRHGHFYARRAMAPLGIDDAEDGIVRASLVHYNAPAEVARFVAFLDDALSA